MKLAIVTV